MGGQQKKKYRSGEGKDWTKGFCRAIGYFGFSVDVVGRAMKGGKMMCTTTHGSLEELLSIDGIRVVLVSEMIGETRDVNRLSAVSHKCYDVAMMSARGAACEIFGAMLRAYDFNRSIAKEISRYVESGDPWSLARTLQKEIEAASVDRDVDARILCMSLVGACPGDPRKADVFRRALTCRRREPMPSYDEFMAAAWLTAAEKISKTKDQWQRLFDRWPGAENSTPIHRLSRRAFAISTSLDHLANLWRTTTTQLFHLPWNGPKSSDDDDDELSSVSSSSSSSSLGMEEKSRTYLVNARRTETVAFGTLYEAFRLVAKRPMILARRRRRLRRQQQQQQQQQQASSSPEEENDDEHEDDEDDSDDDDAPYIHLVDEQEDDDDVEEDDDDDVEEPDPILAFEALIEADALGSIVDLVVERHKFGHHHRCGQKDSAATTTTTTTTAADGSGDTRSPALYALAHRDLPAAWFIHSVARDLRKTLDPPLATKVDRDAYRDVVRRWRIALKHGLRPRVGLIRPHWPQNVHRCFRLVELYVSHFGTRVTDGLLNPDLTDAADTYVQKLTAFAKDAGLADYSKRDLTVCAATFFYKMLPRKFRNRLDRVFFPIYAGLLLLFEACLRRGGLTNFLTWLHADYSHGEIYLRTFIRRLFAIPNLANFHRLHWS